MNVLLQCSDVYCCAEVDTFGHFFMKAKTRVANNSLEPIWDAVRLLLKLSSYIFVYNFSAVICVCQVVVQRLELPTVS